MKTFWKISGIFAVFVTLFVFASAALAQGPANAPARGSQVQASAGDSLNLVTVDEATMHAAIAEALGIGVAELEAALDAGETPATLAPALGVDYAVVQAAMAAVHETAILRAVADGRITQEQADWLLSHNGGQQGHGGTGSQRGRGAGGSGGSYGGECPTGTA